MIVEVLSDSTERYDREEKSSYYRTLPSLQELVLVSQDEVAIEVFAVRLLARVKARRTRSSILSVAGRVNVPAPEAP